MDKVHAQGKLRGATTGGGVMRLPPGFRFHPTDEELVEQYLRRKVFCSPLPASIIPDIELSKFDPWDLPGGGSGSDREWYFFNPRASKYQPGSRSNRATASGYWKATGKDKQVVASKGNRVLGMKKVLVFYRGKLPRGIRTDWIMHEYRLGAAAVASDISSANSPPMEDWVLCRIFLKKRGSRAGEMELDELQHNQARNGRGHANLLDFVRQREAEPEPAQESSCVTEELSDESGGEDGEGSFSSCIRCSYPGIREA